MSQEESQSSALPLNARQQQKLLTQRKLLQAARELSLTGVKLSIADVAKRAGVSVATAYRYYSDPQRLIADATLDAALDGGQQDFVGVFEHAAAGITDPLTRLLIAQRQVMNQMIEHEAAYRLFIAKGYEEIVRQGPNSRKIVAGGRRVLIIEAALKDLKIQMSPTDWADMVHSLMIVIGPEPFFSLTDFTQLSKEAIFDCVETTIAAVFASHWPRSCDGG